jgi:MFS family permease
MEQAQTNSIARQRTPLLALVGSSAVSEIGSTLTFIALPWFVLQSTGSAARTGLTGFAVAVPGFFVGIFGGTLVDRLGYRRSSIVADLVSGIGLALVPALYFTVGLPFVVLMALVFVGSMLAIPGVTSRRSMLPELASQAGTRLERVNSAFESIQHLGLLLGPPAAGLLIAWRGAPTALWVDAATFVFSAIVVGLFVPTPTATAEPVATERSPYRDQVVEGWRFLLRDSLLRDMAITVAIFNGLTAPVFAVALPVFVNEKYGNATVLGLMASVFAVGALAGIAAYGAVGHRLPRQVIWYAGYLLMPGFYWVLATQTSLPALLAVLAFTGFATAPLNPLMTTIRHERIPTAMRGRVFATYSAITQLVSPLGIVLGGFAIATMGFHVTVVVLAVTVQVATIAMLFVPSLRKMGAAK